MTIKRMRLPNSWNTPRFPALLGGSPALASPSGLIRNAGTSRAEISFGVPLQRDFSGLPAPRRLDEGITRHCRLWQSRESARVGLRAAVNSGTACLVFEALVYRGREYHG